MSRALNPDSWKQAAGRLLAKAVSFRPWRPLSEATGENGSRKAGEASNECAQALTALSGQLRRASGDLQGFLAGSEEVFLETSGRLEEFARMARELTEESAAAVRRASSQTARGAAEGLDEDLAQVASYLEKSREATRESCTRLAQLVARAEALEHHRSGFLQLCKQLQALAVCTAVESARAAASATGFGAVADDERRLAALIEAKSQAAAAAAAEVKRIASEALRGTKEFLTRQEGWRSQVLGDARSSVERLRSLAERVAEVGAEAQRASGELPRYVAEVVTSLQFHDITRQRIEHVIEGLGALSGKMERAAAGGDGGEGLGPPSFAEVAVATQLEAAQLAGAKGELQAALGRIQNSLGNLAQQSEGVVDRVRRLAENHTEAGNSLTGQIEDGIGATVALLRELGSWEVETGRAMAAVSAAVGDMTGLIDDVEEIGTEMELVAVNATIKSFGTGAAGRSLAVLAREVRKLSADVARRTGGVSHLLSEIGAESERLDRVAGSGLRREGGRIEEMVTVLDRVVNELRLFEGELGGCVAGLGAGSERLRGEVDRVAEQLGRQSEARVSLDRVLEALAAVAADAARRGGRAADPSALLRAAADRYTMEGERAVHRSVSGGGGSRTPRPADPCDAEFGENVELF